MLLLAALLTRRAYSVINDARPLNLETRTACNALANRFQCAVLQIRNPMTSRADEVCMRRRNRVVMFLPVSGVSQFVHEPQRRQGIQRAVNRCQTKRRKLGAQLGVELDCRWMSVADSQGAANRQSLVSHTQPRLAQTICKYLDSSSCHQDESPIPDRFNYTIVTKNVKKRIMLTLGCSGSARRYAVR